jgi:hypothetical protein
LVLPPHQTWLRLHSCFCTSFDVKATIVSEPVVQVPCLVCSVPVPRTVPMTLQVTVLSWACQFCPSPADGICARRLLHKTGDLVLSHSSHFFFLH